MSAERPTIKEVYDLVDERLKEIPNRRETRMLVALVFLGGQTLASLVTAYITHLSPPEQASALVRLLAGVLS